MASLEEAKSLTKTDDVKWRPEQRSDAACVKNTNLLVILLGMALTGLGVYANQKGYGLSWTTDVAAGLGIMIFFLAFLGYCGARNGARQMLLVYYMLLIVIIMLLIVAGGFCFIWTKQASATLNAQWDDLGVEGQDATTEQEMKKMVKEAQDSMTQNMQIVGYSCFGVAFVLLITASRVVSLVSARRAYKMLLHVLNVTMLPFGVLMVLAGLFVAETATTVEAPETAFSMFVIGMFVVIITLVGSFGTAIESRGLLRMFVWLTFFLDLALWGFGIFVFVRASQVKSYINKNWSKVRQVLPPTFSGKYDRDQFEAFLETNLEMMGFGSLCLALFVFVQWRAASKLRNELSVGDYKDAFRLFDMDNDGSISKRELRDVLISMGQRVTSSELDTLMLEADVDDDNTLSYHEFVKLMKRRKREEEFEMDDDDAMTGGSGGGTLLSVQQQWKRQWTDGSKKSRRCVKCCFGIICCGVVLLTIASTMALVYSTTCQDMSQYSENIVWTPVTGEEEVPAQRITHVEVNNSYVRGLTGFTFLFDPLEATCGTVQCVKLQMEKRASNKGFAPKGFPTPVVGVGTLGLHAIPRNPTRIFSYDLSCQVADLNVWLPPPPYRISDMDVVFRADGDYGGVDAQMPPERRIVDSRPINSFTATTTKGPIDIANLWTRNGGMHVNSYSGSIWIGGVNATCDRIAIGTANAVVHVGTELGSVEMRQMFIANCDLVVEGVASLLQLSDMTMIGGSRMRIEGKKGLVQIDNIYGLSFDIKSLAGGVRGDTLYATQEVKVSADSGSVAMTNVFAGGIIQIETGSGGVFLSVTDEFKGYYTIKSSGLVDITYENGIIPDNNGEADRTGSLSGRIGCSYDCAYFAEVVIVSGSGRVHFEVADAA